MAQAVITSLLSALLIIGCYGYLEFLSTNSKALAPDMSKMDLIGDGEFSISVWFNANYPQSSPTTVFLSTRSQGQPTVVCNQAISSLLVAFHPTWSSYTGFRPFIQLGCNFVTYSAPTSGYTDGNWQHLVITREVDSNGEYTLKYYINKDLVFTQGPPTSANVGTTIESLGNAQGIWIGDDYTSLGYIGKLTQLTFWRRALTADEVKIICMKTECNRITPKDLSFKGLLHYYPMDEDEATCIANGYVEDIRNGNHAVLSSTSDPICAQTCPNPVKQIDIECKTVTGNTVTGAGDISRIRCPRRTLLVSCGIDGWHNVGGTRVRPAMDDVCEAELSEDITTSQPYGVAAVANCCRFPKAAQAEAMTRLSGSGRKVQATCPKPSSLTGCTVDYDSGTTNNIKGSYAGNAVIAKLERNTRNTCIGQARDGSTDVVAGAQCIKLGNTKYDLDCVAVTKYGTRDDMTEANTCPAGYQLLSCMTYSTTKTLDDWHIQDGPVCYVQQDNYDEQYANGVCCKLTKQMGAEDEDEEDEELFDEDDDEEGFMFVHNDGVNYSEILNEDSYNIALMVSVVFVLVIGYVLYKYCYGNDKGYKRLNCDDSDPLLTKI